MRSCRTAWATPRSAPCPPWLGASGTATLFAPAPGLDARHRFLPDRRGRRGLLARVQVGYHVEPPSSSHADQDRETDRVTTAAAQPPPAVRRRTTIVWPFASGCAIGILGGLIGLGGAEFRLPLLMALFGFAALQAVILNKAMSLIVVVAALPARAFAVPWGDVSAHWWVVVNLLAGSLVGAWAAAGWATRMHSRTLHRVLAGLLVAIAVVLALSHYTALGGLNLGAFPRTVVGVLAGLVIGMVAAFMGVAGGELLIPTIVLLFGVDIRLAGSLSLLVSLPTMLIAFTRYSRDSTFGVLRANSRFVIVMGVGSIAGAFIGGAALTFVAGPALIGALALILLISAVKVWRHADD